ncbi:response regulator [Paenibacillus sp. SI8]|uniref:response regulator n=1 Tax=unclassified Paenibacillus TaxID=185978 RepID=UPI0034662280
MIIVEDEIPTLNLMKYVVGQNQYFTIVGAFTSPLEALSLLPKLRPDIAFLDIEMPRMNGLELAEKICEVLEHTKIVFTTAYNHYALDAFRVYAFDYILKPVTAAAIDRIAGRLIKLQHLPAERQEGAVSIRCFGGFEVRNREGALVRFPTRKTEELLAFFLCHPGMDLSKWRLADVLWPEMSEDRASHNLHNTIYRLKKLLKEQEIGMDILKTNEGYTLDPADYSYDVLEYEQYDVSAAERLQDTSQAEQLWSLYKGPLLKGKDYLWKASLEEGFYKEYTALAHSLIELDLAREEWRKVEYRLEAYLLVYPLNEEMNRMLMDLYWSCGNKEKMTQHYARYEAAIRLEMDMDPSSEMRSRIASYLA